MIDPYTDVEMCSYRLGLAEHNDCAVIAIALIADIPYGEAYEAAGDFGRKPRRGMYRQEIAECIASLGYYVAKIADPRQPNGRRWTQRKVGLYIPRGRWLVGFRAHVCACIDGDVLDTNPDSLRRVTHVYMVGKH